MASTVQSIIAAIKSTSSTYLATTANTWQLCRNPYELELLDTRSGERSYGVRPLSASQNDEDMPFGTYVLDHEFELIFTRTAPGKRDDEEITDALEELYDVSDEVYRNIVNTKLNLPLVVRIVTGLSMSEPEILKGGQLIALTLQFTVRYQGNL